MDRALELAEDALVQGEFPVGCVLVSQGRIVGEGRRANSKGRALNELDHAEILALRDWLQGKGTPSSKGDVTAYCTLEPCLMCFGALIINGVRRVVFAYEDVMGGATGLEFDVPAGRLNPGDRCIGGMIRRGFLYRKDRVEIIPRVRRPESLALFKRFFTSPSSAYLKDTLLARYTMDAA